MRIIVVIFSKMFLTWSSDDATTPYCPLCMTSIVATVSTMAAASSVLPYPLGSPMMARLKRRSKRPSTISPHAKMGFQMFSRCHGSRTKGSA